MSQFAQTSVERSPVLRSVVLFYFRAKMSVAPRRSNREILQDFIDLYGKLPCLWQIKSKDYHIRDKKNAAYQQLVDVLKVIDPDANRESVIKKINTYRTNYRKEQKKVDNSKKSGAGIDDVYVPSLWYYDRLHFLRDQETPRTSQSNLSEEESTVRFFQYSCSKRAYFQIQANSNSSIYLPKQHIHIHGIKVNFNVMTLTLTMTMTLPLILTKN